MHPMTHVCDSTNHSVKFNFFLPVHLILFAEYITGSLPDQYAPEQTLPRVDLGWSSTQRKASASCFDQDISLLRCRALREHKGALHACTSL